MKKAGVLILLFIISYKNASAQLDTSLLLRTYIHSEFVFEGVVIDTCIYRIPQLTPSGKMYSQQFSTARIKITRLVRGNTGPGSINITRRYNLEIYSVASGRMIELRPGMKGIF